MYPAKKMNIVLFDEALKHLMRITRIVGMPRGSAMLVGVGGSGKQSLSRLAAFICRQRVEQLVITKDFSKANLLENLKDYYKKAGSQGKPTCFLLTDAQIPEESFLEAINSILFYKLTRG